MDEEMMNKENLVHLCALEPWWPKEGPSGKKVGNGTLMPFHFAQGIHGWDGFALVLSV